MAAPPDVLATNERVVAIAQRLIDGVQADHLSAPTPCTEWDVRALLNHMVGGNRMTAALAAGEPPPDRGADFVGEDPSTAFADSAAAAEAAMRRPGFMEQTYRMPMGEVPGSMLAVMRATDLLVHAWDLAKATGQSTALDPDLCQTALTRARARMGDAPRQPGSPIGPEVEVPADAPVCDRFAAYMGRQP